MALPASIGLAAGKYYLAFTGNSTAAQIAGVDTSHLTFANNAIAAQASVGGQLPATVTPPPDAWTAAGSGGYFAVY